MPIDFVGVNQQITDIGSKTSCVLIDVGYVFGITSFSNSSTLRPAQYEWARTGQSHRSRVRCPRTYPIPQHVKDIHLELHCQRLLRLW